MDFAKDCSDMPCGMLSFVLSIISLGYNLAFVATLLDAHAHVSALNVLRANMHALRNSAGFCLS